jgi:hypothetical protein
MREALMGFFISGRNQTDKSEKIFFNVSLHSYKIEEETALNILCCGTVLSMKKIRFHITVDNKFSISKFIKNLMKSALHLEVIIVGGDFL